MKFYRVYLRTRKPILIGADYYDHPCNKYQFHNSDDSVIAEIPEEIVSGIIVEDQNEPPT